MKVRTFQFLLCFLFSSLLAQGVAQSEPNVLSEKNGHVLNEEHFLTYVQGLISDGTLIKNNTSEEQLVEVLSELILEFQQDPEGVLDFISYYKDSLSDLNIQSYETTPSNPGNAISQGNQIVRNVLGTDIGQMEFDSDKAKVFRNYMTNSLFYDSSSNFSKSGGGSDYTSSSAKIYFCEDGSYVQILSAEISIDVEGAYASSGGDDDIQRGVWEVATLPTGMYILLFYSTEASMLEESPNGFLPFPLASFTDTYVVMPDGSIPYKRQGGQTCN